MLPAKQLFAKFSSVDRLLQTPLAQQDNWYLYMDQAQERSLVKTGEWCGNSTFQFSCFHKNNLDLQMPPSSPPPVSPTDLVQEEDLYAEEEPLSNEEIIERLQETVLLVDKLQERDLLERTLQEVRDLEERLQDVDEIAEKLQEVIEEELGKEEVVRLREEIKQEEIEVRAEDFVDMVVKESVRRFESKEEEVDELEEQIREVFLKGLIPEEGKKKQQVKEEEEEVEVKQVRFVLEEESMQLREESREKLRQMEEEWKKELEEKSSSPGVVTTTAVAYRLEERTTRKRVTVEEERELRPGEEERRQGEGTRKEEGWSQMAEVTMGQAESWLQPEEPRRLEDTDVWFRVFDRPPLTAVARPPGKFILAQNIPGKMFVCDVSIFGDFVSVVDR